MKKIAKTSMVPTANGGFWHRVTAAPDSLSNSLDSHFRRREPKKHEAKLITFGNEPPNPGSERTTCQRRFESERCALAGKLANLSNHFPTRRDIGVWPVLGQRAGDVIRVDKLADHEVPAEQLVGRRRLSSTIGPGQHDNSRSALWAMSRRRAGRTLCHGSKVTASRMVGSTCYRF